MKKLVIIALALTFAACGQESAQTSTTLAGDADAAIGQVQASARMTPWVRTGKLCERSVKVSLVLVKPTAVPEEEPVREIRTEDIYLACPTPVERPRNEKVYKVFQVTRTDIGTQYAGRDENGKLGILTDFTGIMVRGKPMSPAWIFQADDEGFTAKPEAIEK